MNQNKHITVLGAGSFGTSMACLLHRKGHHVTLWAREPEVVQEVEKKKTNSLFLPGATLEAFKITGDLKKSLRGAEVLVFAIPCQFLRPFLKSCKQDLPKDALLINLAKGIEIDTFQTPHQIFTELLGPETKQHYGSISGPTFAREIFDQLPSGAAVASAFLETACQVQLLVSTKVFRLYTVKDLIGVELGGALKNVMALCVGIAEGLGFGLNTRAGLITRCLHEMTEFGVALGAKHRTFSGLSGAGDLILTCTGDLSRNRQVGLRLGRGEKIDDILKSMNQVAEGVATAKSVYQTNQKYKVAMPNAEHVYKIIYEGMSAKEAVQSILARELKMEYT